MSAHIQLHKKIHVPTPVRKVRQNKLANIFPLESKEKIQKDVEIERAQIKTGDDDPTKLGNILEALKKTKKGSMKKPSFEEDPYDICIFKDVGDLTNFEVSPEFSFKDPEPVVEETPVKQEEVEEEIDMEIPLFKTYYHESLLILKMAIERDLRKEIYINTQRRCGNYCKKLAEIREKANADLKAGLEKEEKLQLERAARRKQQIEEAILSGHNAGVAYGKEADRKMDQLMERIQQVKIEEAETVVRHKALLQPVHPAYDTFSADYDTLSNIYMQRGAVVDAATVDKYEAVSVAYRDLVSKAKDHYISEDDVLLVQQAISTGVHVLIAAAHNIHLSVPAASMQPTPECTLATTASVDTESMQPTAVSILAVQPVDPTVPPTQHTFAAPEDTPSAISATVQPASIEVLTGGQPPSAEAAVMQPTAVNVSALPPDAITTIQPTPVAAPGIQAGQMIPAATATLPIPSTASAGQQTGSTVAAAIVPDYAKLLLPKQEVIHGMVQEAQQRYLQVQQKMDQVEQLANAPKNDSPVWMNLARATGIINQMKNRPNDPSNRSKLQQVFNLLAGRTCYIGDVPVSTEGHPPAFAYIVDHFSKNIVNLAHDLQVACMATYASMIVRVWIAQPEIGELMFGRLCEVCPFLVPVTVTSEPDRTEADYHRLLGMRPREPFDKYMARMGAAAALYGRIVAMETDSHPHGIVEGWKFLARVMCQPPYPSVTASVLHGFLTTAGHALLRRYGKQMAKLLYSVGIVYLPQMEANIAQGGRSDLESLKTLLVNFHQKQLIPPPEQGYSLML